MKMTSVENGLRKRKRRRRNPTAKKVGTKANPSRGRRAVSKSSVLAFAKRNGLKVTKTTANPKRKRRRTRRNGTAAAVRTRRNGFFGNTKGEAMTVGGVLGGAVFTKTLARLLNTYAGSYLAQVGLGNYSEIVMDAIVALTITPMIAGKFFKHGNTAKDARLGGLLVVGLTAIEYIAPSVLQYNPFVTSPVIVNAAGTGVSPATVAQIANGVAADANPAAAAAKVGSVMRALDSGMTQKIMPNSYVNRQNPTLVL